MSMRRDDREKHKGRRLSQSKVVENTFSSSDDGTNMSQFGHDPVLITVERPIPDDMNAPFQDTFVEHKRTIGDGKGRLQFLKGYLKFEEVHGEKLERVYWILQSYSSKKQPHAEAILPCMDFVRKLYYIQNAFIAKLQKRLSSASDDRVEVGDIFKLLADRNKALMTYLECIPKLMDLLENSAGGRQMMVKNETKKFLLRPDHIKRTPLDNKVRIKQDLQDPTTWVAQTLEILQSLIELSPQDHPDVETLTLIRQAIVNSFDDQQPINQLFNQLDQDNIHNPLSHLKLYNLVVEWVNPQTDQYKLRFLMVFSELLVCAKIRQVKTQSPQKAFDRIRQADRSTVWKSPDFGWGEVGAMGSPGQEVVDSEQQPNIRLEAKWSIPLNQLVLQKSTRFGTDSSAMLNQRLKIDDLKHQITQLREQRKVAKAVKRPRLDTQILKLEFELMLQTPQMAINLSDGQGHSRVLLMATERERDNWIEDLMAIMQKSKARVAGGQPAHDALTRQTLSKPSQDGLLDVIPETKPRSSFSKQLPSLSEITQWIKKYQHLVRLNRTGLALIEDEYDLTGILCLTIMELSGLDSNESYHIRIESDAYGQLEEVARTRAAGLSKNPEWNQSFDIQIDGVQQLCFSLYCHCDVLAVFDVAADKETLTEAMEKHLRAKTKGPDPKTVVLTCSWKLLSSAEVYPRTSSLEISCVFGRELRDLVKFDSAISSASSKPSTPETNQNVPQVVKACVEEIERRGLKEVGIYRICGSNTDIQNLKKAIDSNQRQGLESLSMFEIFVVTSTVKLLFHQLPTALLTDTVTKELMEAVELKDPSLRTAKIVKSLQQLPVENRETFEYLTKHLLNVARYHEFNKMGIGNLALIWSPALFQAPSVEESVSEPSSDLEGNSHFSTLIKQAAIGCQQTKVLHTILTDVLEAGISLPLPTTQ